MKIFRSRKLVADFQDGFALGWKMAVGEWFRPALDISLDWRGKKEARYQVWTQGQMYRFTEGDVVYDCRLAYLAPWFSALQRIKIAVQVVAASPCVFEGKSLGTGFVRAQVYIPGPGRETLVKDRVITCDQHEFVRFLKTGILPGAAEVAGKRQLGLFN
jgi:hypothetical protein